VLLWSLLALAPVAAIACIVWAYRRKFSEKEAASRERLAVLLGETRTAPPASASAAPAGGATGVPTAAPGPAWTVRERFLSQPETLLYYLLKSGLPEHEIFAHVSLAALVGVAERPSGFDRGEQLRRLAQHELAFVVCDKNMRVVAAVELNRAASASALDLKAECLKAAGVRLLRVDPAALPGREAIRALVRGAG